LSRLEEQILSTVEFIVAIFLDSGLATAEISHKLGKPLKFLAEKYLDRSFPA